MTRTLAALMLLLLSACATSPAPVPSKFERCMAAVASQGSYASDRLRVAEWCANYEKSAP